MKVLAILQHNFTLSFTFEHPLHTNRCPYKHEQLSANQPIQEHKVQSPSLIDPYLRVHYADFFFLIILIMYKHSRRSMWDIKYFMKISARTVSTIITY